MKAIQVTTTLFESVDGERYDTLEECLQRDVALLDMLLATLGQDEIRAALRRVGLIVRADRSFAPPPEPTAEGVETRQ